MDYASIIKDYTEEKKSEIVNLAKINKSQMNLHNTYNHLALDLFFVLWHKHFPNVRQTKTCTGCRQAVVKFFGNVADYISSERLKAAETVKVVQEKSKKVVKNKTRTGALSPTGVRK
tara:strand:- start:627 stop:977 length:351 start_codon:yes stop_codon:yes gene_type:complete